VRIYATPIMLAGTPTHQAASFHFKRVTEGKMISASQSSPNKIPNMRIERRRLRPRARQREVLFIILKFF
jgi:hypothetical protein